MEWVKTLRCLICELLGQRQATITEAAHIGGNAAAKASNWHTIPLCYEHHRSGKAHCEEVLKRRFWDFYGLVKEVVFQNLRNRYERQKDS